MAIFRRADKSGRMVFALLALAWGITGCAGLSSMERTRVTRDGTTGATTVKNEPYPVPEDKSLWGVVFRDDDMSEKHSLSDEPSPRSRETGQAVVFHDEVREKRGGGIKVGISSMRLWSKLTSDFSSSSFSRVKWDRTPDLVGYGVQADWIMSREDAGELVLRMGMNQHDPVTNFQQENNLFAREKTDVNIFFLEPLVNFRPAEWFSLGVGLAGFLYDVETTIDSNAPAFNYEGFTGFRGFLAIGFHGGLETPWRFPVRLYADSGFYLPYNPLYKDQDFLETAAGTVSAGLLWRFGPSEEDGP